MPKKFSPNNIIDYFIKQKKSSETPLKNNTKLAQSIRARVKLEQIQFASIWTGAGWVEFGLGLAGFSCHLNLRVWRSLWIAMDLVVTINK